MMGQTTRIGRPVGSKSGRVPEGGYPELSDATGAFLAGFIEGEGSFVIRKQAGYECHGCEMSLKVRADDWPLLSELRDATEIGRLTSAPARGNSAPQITWTVTAKSDCLRLIEILDDFPLRGAKSRAYAVWRAAARWWIGTDAARTEANRDWTPMAYLKGRLSEANAFDDRPIDLSDRVSGLGGDWAGFLSGFITAEGHFGLYRGGSRRRRPTMAIHLRSDDIWLLRELATRAGVGRIYGPYDGHRNPSVRWSVFASAEVRELVGTLDNAPPRGRKGVEYEIWRQAVLDMVTGGRAAGLEQAARDLARQRKFAPDFT